MSDQPLEPENDSIEGDALHSRRQFLQGVGKWSGAAIVAALGLGMSTEASAGGWINRRGGGGGGWINRR